MGDITKNIHSSDLDRIIGIFNQTFKKDLNRNSFAKCLLGAMEYNMRQELLVLAQCFSRYHGHWTRFGNVRSLIDVLEVEISSDKIGTLQAVQAFGKEPKQKENVSLIDRGSLPKLILIHSDDVQPCEAKKKVFEKFASLLDSKDIFIHHSSENLDHIATYVASQRLTCYRNIIRCLSSSIPSHSVYTIISTAFNKVLSFEMIKEMCYAVCIDRYGDIVGTVKSEKYICYSKITVNAFKRDLIDKTLRNLIKMIEAEIRKDILHHVKSSFEISIKDKAQLDNLPNDLNAEFSFIRDSFLSISWPIDEVSMAYLFITWLMPIDVNSTSWRTGVANEISEQIHAKKSTIINGMASKIREMCNHTTEDLGNTILQLEKCIESAKMTVKHEPVKGWMK